RLDFLIAGERFRRGSRRFRDRVTNLNDGDSLNRCGEKTDFAGGKFIGWRWPRTIHAQRSDLVIAAGGHETNLHARANHAVDRPISIRERLRLDTLRSIDN